MQSGSSIFVSVDSITSVSIAVMSTGFEVLSSIGASFLFVVSSNLMVVPRFSRFAGFEVPWSYHTFKGSFKGSRVSKRV